MSSGHQVAFSLHGLELALVPSALTVFLDVPFTRIAKPSLSAEEHSRLEAEHAALSDACDRAYAAVGALPGSAPRPELIERRKGITIEVEVDHVAHALMCRALRAVSAEYQDEPKGINVFFGGDEYGATIADLIAVTNRLCGLASTSRQIRYLDDESSPR